MPADLSKHGMNVLSTVIHLLGASILAYCFALRSARENLFSFRQWGQISWPRWLVILVFVDSWLFLFFTGVLINGVGLGQSLIACQLAIYSCIFFYGLSKVLIYLFLIEKVYVVWPYHGGSRWTSTVYRICLAVMSGYVVIIVLMILGKIAYHRDDGQCTIGLKTHVSISLLTYDLFLNIFLTGMFMWPLTRNTFARPAIRRVASRTLVAALAALTTSTVNVAVLTVLHGVELGWVCLGSCGTDVTLNAMILFWVTSPTSEDGSSSGGPTAYVSGGGVKGNLPRSGSEGQRIALRVPEGSPSPARLTFSTQPGDRHSHVYPPSMRSMKEEDDDSTDSEKKEGKSPSFFTKVSNAFGMRNKDARAEEGKSVQVTITTEFAIIEEPPQDMERSKRASILNDTDPSTPTALA